ncbi:MULTISPECIES: tail protein X [Bartonella]|uniref:Phage Tail Protein X n=3 Tax=Bartonella TaxID=773 RepID=A0A336NB68_BARGR|nr:tail protein X [Bartonella grahamii]ACS51244.1 phage tail protein X3 [Bartonella grahamii as4aup]SSZ39142.1 Phage Tail Protein X [Bartonella grahamii]SSZ39276.1 Phage Tail Protein X [Bartonella grahamii]SSZ39320.1 Phage Tail Protein X [Bartonella grahamii]SSZ40746.1 Phage Tail Protein X [Bartonella grahamii]
MKIPEKHVVVELEDMSLDLICFHHAMAVFRDRIQVGALNGYLEATLEANPEIAKYGVLLPRGLTVILPEFVLSNPQSMVKRLWD